MTDALLLKSGLRMPSSFVEVKDDEIEYLEAGAGLSVWAKIGIVAAVSVVCAGVAVAIAYGCIAIVAAALKVTLAVLIKKFTATVIAATISAALAGFGAGIAFGIQICNWIDANS